MHLLNVNIDFKIIKIVLFPSDILTNGIYSHRLSLLGLGDIVLPGLYLAFNLRYDHE